MTIIVNGPIVNELGINSGENLFGPGNRANMTIGRSIRLLMMNSLNTRPGALDRSTIGTPAKISFCFAENESLSPWEPLHVERGYRPEDSTTTVLATEDIIQVYNQLAQTPEPLLGSMADTMANMGSLNIISQRDVVIVLAQEHLRVISDANWSKQQVRQYLFDRANRSVAPDDIIIVCAGGVVGTFSACLLGWGGSRSATATVTTPIQ
ncbi:MAG: hypothetical protein P8X39_13270 [Desulfofustis sp.]